MNIKRILYAMLVSLFSLSGCSTDQVPQIEEAQTNQKVISIFLIALDDNGKSGQKIAYNDSLVAINRTIPESSNPVETALLELFSVKEKYDAESGLYNFLYDSDLKIQEINIDDGLAEVYLTGDYNVAGIIQESQIDAQIRQTILQFPKIREAKIFFDGSEILEGISEKTDAEILSFLLDKLKDPNYTSVYGDYTWYIAAEELGQIGKPAIPYLIQKLDTDDDYERTQTLYALSLATQDENVLVFTGENHRAPAFPEPEDHPELVEEWKEWFEEYEEYF